MYNSEYYSNIYDIIYLTIDLLSDDKTTSDSNVINVLQSIIENKKYLRIIDSIIFPLLESLSQSDVVQKEISKLQPLSDMASNGLELQDSTQANIVVFYNSRKIIITEEENALDPLDFELFANVEEERIGKALLEALLTLSESTELVAKPFTSDSFLYFSSYCGRSESNKYDIKEILDETGSFSFDRKTPLFANITSQNSDISIIYVVDPLTVAGQRAAALVQFINNNLHFSQMVMFTPRLNITTFPLQNFYRFVTSRSNKANDKSTNGLFVDLPRKHVLTVRIDTAEAWNVQTLLAVQDIDNLKCDMNRCGDVSNSQFTHISYTLKNLLIAGQCFEGAATGNYKPPNGLQLVLYDDKSTSTPIHFSDTLVMQNLGYYQLATNPGLWLLNLAPGRGQELYSIDGGISDSNRNKSWEQGALSIPVKSYFSTIRLLHVSKRPGKEYESLLMSDADAAQLADEGVATEGSTLWNSISGLWNNKKSEVTHNDNEVIHVFSLATGHVYERLLRIMMLSVTKRTQMKVKFWLLENYLSPSFKQTVNTMKEIYKFDVGYVTYKWPEWLTQQTEKQRIIWGYKILFLDVLFPLDVKKVIYVDADQVVRSDLKELWDMDLKGKPYAYTPFCSSRKETLGFQFWRQGYWADHLRGKPYHISALYVVDLQLFRL
jgi:UDP-glucose:glycoprotein glucosyltransferase